MSPARQTNGSSDKRKVRQTTIDPNIRAERNAIDSRKKKRDFDPIAFIGTIDEGRKFVFFPSKETLFAQGDPADAVFYIQTGKVRLTVVSKTGKEATIGIRSEENFFGEGSLAGQALDRKSVVAMADCAVLRIDKKAMMEALHR